MPDNENLLNTQELEDSVSIDNLTQSPDLDGDDVIVMVHENNGVKSTYKAILRSIANFINKLLHYSTDLHTQNDTIIGAINELADGGGSTDIISEASGTIATFNDGGDNIPVKSLVTDIVAVQSGTGTPSPSNDRQITGFDSVEVVVGVNLWDEQWEVGSINEQGNTPSSTRIRTKGYIKVIPGNTYYVKSPNNIWVWGYDENKNYKARIPDTSAISNRTITIPSDVYFIRFVVVDAYGTTYNNDISINYPSTDTAYHHSSAHTITLPETIYGGTAELVGGNGIKTHGYVDLSTLSWTSASQNTWVATLTGVKEVTTGLSPIIAEKYQTFSNNDLYYNNETGIATYSNQVIVRNDPTTDTPTGLAVFELQTPTTFTFTPEQIPTLSGDNNIYSNTGDIEVEYFNENADQTSELIDAKQEYTNYSYDEKVVGTWVDGSPLYEKTLYFNNKALQKNDNDSELKHGVSNIGSVKFVTEAYCDFEGGQNWKPCQNMIWDNSNNFFQMVVGSTAIYLLSASGVYFNANPNRSYLVKIRYTKA